MQRHVLISDGDGHWYICPADKQEEASAYFEAMDKYWSPWNKEEIEEPDEPKWLVRIGGSPSLVEFTDYIIR